jgi:hypothetical protein
MDVDGQLNTPGRLNPAIKRASEGTIQPGNQPGYLPNLNEKLQNCSVHAVELNQPVPGAPLPRQLKVGYPQHMIGSGTNRSAFLWPILRHYPGIRMEVLRKTRKNPVRKNWCSGRDLKRVRLEDKS